METGEVHAVVLARQALTPALAALQLLPESTSTEHTVNAVAGTSDLLYRAEHEMTTNAAVVAAVKQGVDRLEAVVDQVTPDIFPAVDDYRTVRAGIVEALAHLRPVARLHRRRRKVVVIASNGTDDRASRPPEDDDDERRIRGDRVRLHAPVGVQTHHGAGFFGTGADLSEGGLFIGTRYPEPVGATVTISFALPDGKTVEAEAKVRWVREAVGDDPGMGVAFDTLDDATRDAILDYCRRNHPSTP